MFRFPGDGVGELMADRIPSKRQQQAAATQEQLLDAARAVFGERGYQATTVGAITTRANTAHGTFYLYFRNKQDVFAGVMTSVTDELYREADLASSASDPRAALEGILRQFGVRATVAANLVVVHSELGSAPAIARALDRLDHPKIVGTLAGDDTCLVVTASTADARKVARELTAAIA